MNRILTSIIAAFFVLNLFLFGFVKSTEAFVFIYGQATTKQDGRDVGLNELEFKFNQSIKLDYCPADFRVKSKSSVNRQSASTTAQGGLSGSTCWGLESYTQTKDRGFVDSAYCFSSLGKAAAAMGQTNGWWQSTIISDGDKEASLAGFDRSIPNVDPSEGRCSVLNCGRAVNEKNTVTISIKNSPPSGKTRGRYFVRNFKAVQDTGGPEKLTARQLRDSTDVITSSSTGYTDIIEAQIPFNVNGPYDVAVIEWVDESGTPPPGGVCSGPCELTNAAACESGKTSEPGCACLPTETGAECRKCPTGDDAGTFTPVCPAGSFWSASLNIKTPPGDTTKHGGPQKGWVLFLAEKVDSANLLSNFGSDKKVSKAPTASNTVVFYKEANEFSPHANGGIDKPLDPNKQYVVMIYDGSETCRPILELPVVQNSCPGGQCRGTCDLDNPTCPASGPALANCFCIDKGGSGPGGGNGVCEPCPPGTKYNTSTNKCDVIQCNADCTKNDTSACDAASSQVPGCVCVVGSDNTNGKCQTCPTGTRYNTSTKKCDGDACNQVCDPTRPNPCPGTTNPNQPDSTCPVCVPNSPTSGTCQPPPTPSPTPRFFCDQPCDVSKPNECAEGERLGCDICRNKDGGGTTCQPFSKNFCQCEKLLASRNPIIPGQRTTFDAFYKVEGPDIKHAELKSVRFRMVELKADGTSGDGAGLPQSEPISPEIIENTPTIVRYKASWTMTVPLNIKSGAKYMVFVPTATSSQFGADFKCERKRVTALGLNQRVLGLPTNAPWWCRVIPFSSYFFSACKEDSSTPAEPAPSPSSDAESNLQLKTFAPAKMINQTCSQYQFEFSTF